MTTSPLKPKRSAGGSFLTIWQGNPNSCIWIEENYNLYRHPELRLSKRDKAQLKRDRERHIDNSVKIQIGDCLYVVDFRCEMSDDMRQKVVEHYHNQLTVKVNFDE